MPYGTVSSKTRILISIPASKNIEFDQEESEPEYQNLQVEFDRIRELGVGGLDHVVSDILNLIVLPHSLTASQLNKVQLQPSRGMIFSGPPGTGKTLLAHTLSDILNAHFQVVRGPELMTGVVGGAAEAVRRLFDAAEADWKEYGCSSPLHVIVIDEIDSLCPPRGYSNGLDGGASNQVVGQFLAMLDGMTKINNIILVGTTNRYDMIDSALKRPGRLEHHFAIGLPDQDGREAIWRIHTEAMVQEKIIDEDWIPELAKRSEGFSGA